MKNKILGIVSVIIFCAITAALIGLFLPEQAEAQGGATVPRWADDISATLADGTGEIDTTLENTRAAAGRSEVIVDSINAHKVWNVRTSTSAWAATEGPVLSSTSNFTGTGVWRIENLGAVNVSGNNATGTNLIFAIGQFGGAGIAMSLVNAIEDDAAGVRYTCEMDTIVTTVETAANIPIYAASNNRRFGFVDADASVVPQRYSFYTPPGSWVISDSTSATNTGTRYLYIRAVPISAGATLTAN